MKFGFHRHGQCWGFTPERREYANCVFWSWWRLYLMVRR